MGIWSRNLQGMILNQKGEVAALEFKKKIYGSFFLRVWKVLMGSRPSSPPTSVRSVKRQLVMEKEQNSRRRRVSQTPNLMPPNLRSIMKTQEVEGLCKQLWAFSYGFKTTDAMSARWFYYRGATVFGLIKPSTDITCVYGGV
ncbi:hypothetical protein HID58_043007 [Brassica napus]|uniref:Uncharacterized protein n=1 Tax=Brassica napus TaxID=3708 RepID=A0ABQ8BF91_BRANA|nr:hypothetical protein HID58_043007 [Brassica napus]